MSEVALVAGWFPPPSPPKSPAPVPLLLVQKSLPVGTREDDPRTSRPAHGPTALAQRFHARSAGSALSLARSCRSWCKPASPAPAGSRSNVPEPAPRSPRYLLPTCAVLLRSPGRLLP